jgi:hypothetical protein
MSRIITTNSHGAKPMTTIIGVVLNNEYNPLINEINAISNELGISRSAVIRHLLCESVGFEPQKHATIYSKS